MSAPHDMALTPALLRAAYAAGIFPMSDARDDHDIGWYDPPLRGVMPIETLHVPRRLRRTLAQHPYIVTFNRDFAGVMRGCAGDSAGMTVARPSTWINDEIIAAFTALHREGDAHSVEVWRAGEGVPPELVGGIYGIALGGAFFGESMFSRARDASKIALVFLTARLWQRGFTLFDAQFFNPHLAQFGMEEIKRDEYHHRLSAALAVRACFADGDYSLSSNEPGSSCKVGTAAEPPDTGATGAICTGSGRGAGAACLGVVSAAGVAASSPSSATGCSPAASFVSGAAAAASSGAVSGAFSAEYVSAAATVASFLHSITQTS